MPKVSMEGWECYRCKHRWVPRDEETPRVCPKCKSPYWDIPRGTKGNDLRKISTKPSKQKETTVRVMKRNE